MSKTTVCSVLLDLLVQAGARRIYGVTGDALNPLLEGLRKDGRLEWIGVRHEETAAYAAGSEAILSGGIGVCAGTVGPGALHLINGLYNAKRENAGVIAITGQVAHREMATSYHQEVDLNKMFDDVCGFQAVIHSPEQMPRLARIAIQRALAERIVVRIELPIDISELTCAPTERRHRLLTTTSPFVPDDASLNDAADLINGRQRVTLLCGVGCRGARDTVLSLAQRIQVPIVHTLKAKDLFDTGDDHVVGMTGLIGTPSGYHAVMEAQTLVMLGTDFPYEWFLPEDADVVQVDRQVGNIGRRVAVNVPLHGSVKDTVNALLTRLDPLETRDFLEHHQTIRDRWEHHLSEQATEMARQSELHPQLVVREVSERATEDAVISVDVGESTVWLARQMRLGGSRRLVGSFNHSSVGSGFPCALGAAAVNPARQVWALCGDGGFGMSMQDFVTAVRYNLPIKVVVFNNGELSFVKMEMEVAGYAMNDAVTGLTNPGFSAYADICGGKGFRIETPEQIGPALDEAIAYPGPVIIEAMVSPGELVMPPHINLHQAWGFGISKVKEAVLGMKGDHAQWENWKAELK